MVLAGQAHLRLRTVLRQCSTRLTNCASQHHRAVAPQALAILVGRRSQTLLSAASSHRLSARKLLRCMSASTDTAELIKEKNAANSVVIYSKSYCPFSGQVKDLFRKLKVEYKSFELDEIVEGDDVLDSLMDKTSSRTVPQVFIKGQFIGGCDETLSQYRSGKLQKIFEQAGVPASF